MPGTRARTALHVAAVSRRCTPPTTASLPPAVAVATTARPIRPPCSRSLRVRLEVKIQKLEQLVRLKDSKIATLQAKMQVAA